MRILVTGGRGQLAHEIKRIIETGQAEIGPVDSAYRDAQVDYIDIDDLDISNAAATDAWFVGHKPYDIVINCAAMTNVDGCEANFPAAFAANALGPMNLARACARQDAKLVQVSTDYVFPGTEAGSRLECDAPAPLSAYGRSKLAGEGLAQAANPRTFVVRTAWLYGYVGKNFVYTMKSLGERLSSVTVVDDQIGNPTSANDLAYEILKLALTDDFGVYHCTNEGSCSWAVFAEAIMHAFHLECEVVHCTSEEYKAAHPDSADRPHFSSLENAQLAAGIGNEMRPWQEALATFAANAKAYAATA